MITLNVHVRQDMSGWTLTGALTEDHGSGLPVERSTTVWSSPLTATEWDSDPLTAVLSALARWSGMTIEDALRSRKA